MSPWSMVTTTSTTIIMILLPSLWPWHCPPSPSWSSSLLWPSPWPWHGTVIQTPPTTTTHMEVSQVCSNAAISWWWWWRLWYWWRSLIFDLFCINLYSLSHNEISFWNLNTFECLLNVSTMICILSGMESWTKANYSKPGRTQCHQESGKVIQCTDSQCNHYNALCRVENALCLTQCIKMQKI